MREEYHRGDDGDVGAQSTHETAGDRVAFRCKGEGRRRVIMRYQQIRHGEQRGIHDAGGPREDDDAGPMLR